MRTYVEHLIHTLLNNQNVSLCGQKSVELIKKPRFMVNSEDPFMESITPYL